MHREMLVEPRDRERPVGLEPGRGEQERLAVLELRARFDQDPQSGRVDEVHPAQVDDKALRLLGAELQQRRPYFRGVVEVELADEVDHDGAVPALHSCDGMLVQRRLVHLVGKHSHVGLA